MPSKSRTKKGMLDVIINVIKAGPTKRAITAPARKKNGSALTKPAWLKHEGTLYRMVIVMTCEEGRPLFMKTRDIHDRELLDKRNPHPVYNYGMANIINLSAPYLDMVADARDVLVGYSVLLNISAMYDR